MKAVIVSASPRKNANTEIVMKHVTEYTSRKDVSVEFINLSEYNIEC